MRRAADPVSVTSFDLDCSRYHKKTPSFNVAHCLNESFQRNMFYTDVNGLLFTIYIQFITLYLKL